LKAESAVSQFNRFMAGFLVGISLEWWIHTGFAAAAEQLCFPAKVGRIQERSDAAPASGLHVAVSVCCCRNYFDAAGETGCLTIGDGLLRVGRFYFRS
jgi:hypothetical protein